jgi:hypothetical protein
MSLVVAMIIPNTVQCVAVNRRLIEAMLHGVTITSAVNHVSRGASRRHKSLNRDVLSTHNRGRPSGINVRSMTSKAIGVNWGQV